MNNRVFPRRAPALILALAASIAQTVAQNGMLQFSSIAYSAKESAPSARITVARVGGSAGELSVTFTTVDSGGGTAVAGQDYYPTNGTLVFGPGVTTRDFYVPIINDSSHEGSETITLELSTMVGDNNATLTLLDNDSCSFAISPLARSHGPEAGSGTIQLAATTGCAWTATESADWISIISDASGSGSNEVQYSFDANPGAATRKAVLIVAGRSFAVTQLGLFAPLAGQYHGLFHEELILQHETSGLLSLAVSDLGSFSAKLILGGQRLSFSGGFATDGQATNVVARPNASPVTVQLSIDLNGGTDQITGVITDGVWTSHLLADRAVFKKQSNEAPQAGRYTLVVRGDEANSDDVPGGDSIGTVTVDVAGNVKLGLTLADGTKASQKIPLSKNGEWPLYVPLLGGAGSILSRVTFTNIVEESDFSGTFSWFKPALNTGKYYRAGFAGQQPLAGSRYTPPTNSTDRVLELTAANVAFTAGNLPEAFTNAVSLSEANKVTNLTTNKLTLAIALPSGLFSGSVVVPGSTRSTPFKGAVFQKANFGSGFILGTNRSGRVLLSE